MLISLIVPIFNEEQHLLKFLENLDDLKLGHEKELIFIDDSSKDLSLEILNSYNFKSKHKIISNKINKGKGFCIQLGIEISNGNIILIQDADFEYDMNEIVKLIDPILKDKADVVYGSRFHKQNYQVHRTFHYLINRILTLISNFLSGLYLSDMETCYKVFKSEIIQNVKLQTNRFGFEPEITAKIAKLKIRVMEIPISYYPRNYLEGKKITWKDGFAAIWHILYFNILLSKNRFFKSSIPSKYIPSTFQWL